MPPSPFSDTILTTKLYWAKDGPEVVPRPRLFEALNDALNYRLTLIQAPAGYGKSTLVRNWIDVASIPCAWVLLDTEDSSPYRFWRYVTSAVRTLFPDALEATLDLLNGVVQPPHEVFLRTLINELDAITPNYVLVLDDFDRIADADTLSMIAELMRHPPRSLHLLLITRVEPDLPLLSLRARNQIQEFVAEDLRFTPQEAAVLLERHVRQMPDAAALHRILDYTGGWIAGLRLVISSLNSSEDVLRRLPVSPVEPAGMLDYLGMEVFRSLSEFDQDFLVRTSILDRVCVALADTLLTALDSSASADLLARYSSSSAFVSALDPENTWFRVHPLFREFLLTQLRFRFSSDEIAALHLRASAWLSNADLIEDALRHAEQGGGEAAVARFLITHGMRLLERNRVREIEPWLRRLPDSRIHDHLELVLLCGYLAYSNGHLRELVTHSERAETLIAALTLSTPLSRKLRGAVCVLRGMVAGWTGDSETLLQAGQQALDLLPDESNFIRLVAHTLVASGLILSAQTERAITLLYDQLRKERQRNSEWAPYILHVLCLNQWQFGRGSELAATVGLLADLGHRYNRKDWICMADYFLGCSQSDAGHWPEAVQHLRHVLDNPYQVETVYFVQAACAVALIHQEEGNGAAADAVLASAWQTLVEMGNTDFLGILTLLEIELKLRRGIRADPAHAYVERVVQSFSYTRGLYEPALTYPRLLLAYGDASSLQKAADYLQPLRAQAQAAQRRRALIDTLIVQAMVLDAQGHAQQANETLLIAVRQIQSGDEKRLLVVEPARIRTIMHRLPAKAISRDERRRLLDTLGTTPSVPVAGSPLLTKRELSVLRLMNDGLSNEEISAQLVISKGTVKQHIHRIFQKLDVNNRTGAVYEARRQNLL